MAPYDALYVPRDSEVEVRPSDCGCDLAVVAAPVERADPLQFVAILIPRRLGEDPRFADGVLYEMRKRFIRFLTHGLTDEQRRERLLVSHLRNRSGQSTYVHAKNMVVGCLVKDTSGNDRKKFHQGYPALNLNMYRIVQMVYPHLAVIEVDAVVLVHQTPTWREGRSRWASRKAPASGRSQPLPSTIR